MDLLVHPKSVWLIVYPGGYCGEFLSWWLSMHPRCIRVNYQSIGKNRYVVQHPYNYILDETGTRDNLFLIGHWHDQPSKNNMLIADSAQHIQFFTTSRYHRFYNYLYMIKTVFYKYHVKHPPSVFKNKPQDWQNFVKYLNGRQDFTGAEMESWLQNNNTTPDRWVEYYWRRSSRIADYQPRAKFRYDISKLFFGDFSSAYSELCQLLEIPECYKLTSFVPDYHQENLKLVEQYTGMQVDEFLDLSETAAIDLIKHNIQSLLQEPYSFV